MSKKIAHILLLATALLWGMNFVSLKYLSNVFPPYTLVFVKFGIATLFLWSILLSKQKKGFPIKRLEKIDYKGIILTGIAAFVLYSYFQIFSFSYLSANLSALLCALVPICSLLAEVLILKKKCSPITYVLSLLSLYGVYLVLDMKLGDFFSSTAIWGILLMMSANITWVAYTMTTGHLQAKYGSLSSLTYQMTAGSIFLGLISIRDFAQAVNTLRVSDQAWLIILNLLFVGIGTSALAYLFYISGMEVIGIQLSSLYINFIPVVTAIASYFIFKEHLTIHQLIGMVLVIGSIIFINKAEENHHQKINNLKASYTIT